MRFRLLLISLSLFGLLSSVESYAQGAEDEVFITTKANAKLYPVPKDQFFGSNHRETRDYVAQGRAKIMSTPEHARVIGLTNLAPSLSYDSYIILLKGKRYYIHSGDVQDNSYMDNQNKELQTEYESLCAAVIDNERTHMEAFNRIVQKIDSLIREDESAIKTIDTRADSLEFEYVKGLVVEDISKANSNSQKYRDWIKTLPADVQFAAESFAILHQSLDATPGGAYNYSIDFVNWSPKTIMSIIWNGHIKNTRGEYLTCNIKGTSDFSERFTGAVSALSRSFASWNSIIYNNEASMMELSALKIEYTDGTSIILDKNALQYVSNIPADAFDRSIQSLQSAYDGLSDSALKAPWVFELNRVEFRNSLIAKKKERQDRIAMWNETKTVLLQEGLWSNQIEHMGIGLANSNLYQEILDELRVYGNTQRDKKILDDNLLKFKRRNLIAD